MLPPLFSFLITNNPLIDFIQTPKILLYIFSSSFFQTTMTTMTITMMKKSSTTSYITRSYTQKKNYFPCHRLANFEGKTLAFFIVSIHFVLFIFSCLRMRILENCFFFFWFGIKLVFWCNKEIECQSKNNINLNFFCSLYIVYVFFSELFFIVEWMNTNKKNKF